MSVSGKYNGTGIISGKVNTKSEPVGTGDRETGPWSASKNHWQAGFPCSHLSKYLPIHCCLSLSAVGEIYQYTVA
jgi:hypothetical protein